MYFIPNYLGTHMYYMDSECIFFGRMAIRDVISRIC